MDAKFNNDEVGASAYDPRVMLKVVLLGYSQGLVSSRAIERACLHNVFTAKVADCQSSALRSLCRKSESSQRGKQVSRFEPKVRAPTDCSERLRLAIDSVRGRQLYSQRIGTVEPVFGNIRHNKGLARSGTCTAWCTTSRSWPTVCGGSEGKREAQQRPEAP